MNERIDPDAAERAIGAVKPRRCAERLSAALLALGARSSMARWVGSSGHTHLRDMQPVRSTEQGLVMIKKAHIDNIRAVHDRLAAVTPYPWSNVLTAVAILEPIIRHAFPDHVAGFNAVRKEPLWVMLPRFVSGGGRYGGPQRDNFAEAEATENRENTRIAAEARDQLIGFLEGLLLLADQDAPDPPASPAASTAPDLPVKQPEKKGDPVTPKPRIFIGSSKEGLTVAKLLQLEMDYDAEVTLWSQGVFGLSGGTLETLVKTAPTFDFAVLVLTPDDVVTKRDGAKNAPRDNVLFELGLFMGALGRDRTYIVHPRVPIDLPSDLAGIEPATYDPNRADGNLHSAIGPAATRILSEVKKLGRR